MRIIRRAVLGGFAAAGFAGQANAADWPSRALDWIVPFPPGGSNDTFARPIAAFVGQRLGEPVVVSNRGGAGGTMGAKTVALAAPNGYSMLVGNTGLTYASLVYPDTRFELERDLVPISGFASVPVVLVVNPAKFDVTDFAAFLAAVRKSPGKYNIGSSGLGTIPHLAIELLKARTGIDIVHVPYRGGGPALQDMLNGQIDSTFQPLSTVVAYVQAGRLRALAVAAAQRETLMPDLPTFAEVGLPDFRVSSWYGLFAPKATPAPILDTLHDSIQTALADANIRRIWAEQGAHAMIESRRAFTEFVARETRLWSEVARTTSIPME
jgi:tripartite-type tricarboxylate transporter receptor subunit TctC